MCASNATSGRESKGEHASYLPLVRSTWKNDQDLTLGAHSSTPVFTGPSTYLRVTRCGNQLSAAFSKDGVEWTGATSITVEFPQKIKVGVDAINTSKPPLAVEFSELKLTANKPQ